MKLEKKLVHALPLATILGISGIVVAGNIVINDKTNVSAADTPISMTVSGNLDFKITPEVGGTYAEKTIDVTVNTPNSAGYTLYMSAKNNSSEAVVNSSSDGIVSIEGEIAKKDMPINSWGYFVGGNKIKAIPEKGNPDTLKVTDTPSNDDNKTTTVGFGVKVDPTLRSGNYNNAVSFSAVPNVACEGFYCINTMQEMTPAICEATTTPLVSASEVTYEASSDRNKIPRTILTDTRDNKKYLVSKFADGKCWMSQNLDLELSSTKALTNADTDLNSKSSWTPNASTADGEENLLDYGYSQTYYADYWTAKSIRSGVKYLRDGVTPAATASTSDGKSEWEATGIYYNGLAATADSIRDTFDEEDPHAPISASDSICPKGWRLPKAAFYDSPENDYVIFSNLYEGALVNDEIRSFGELLAFNATGLASANSGYGQGDVAQYWTASVSDRYYKDINTSAIYDTYSYGTTTAYMHNGLPIRCIAR